MKIFLTSDLLEEAVVILDKERTVEADLMTVATVTGKGSTTEEEMAVMTPVVEVEDQETTEAEAKAKEAEENLIAKVEVANHVSIETTGRQKDLDVAVVAVGTISVNRVTIILADELICAAS